MGGATAVTVGSRWMPLADWQPFPIDAFGCIGLREFAKLLGSALHSVSDRFWGNCAATGHCPLTQASSFC